MKTDGSVLVELGWAALHGSDDGTWVARKKKKDPWVRLDAAGEIVHTFDGDFEDLRGYVGDHAPAMRGKRWGVVDRKGRWTLEPISERFPRLREGLPFQILVKRKLGFATVNEVVVEPAYATATEMAEGHAIADLSVLDGKGEVVATVDPSSTAIVLTPPPPPRGKGGQGDHRDDPTRGEGEARRGRAPHDRPDPGR